MIKRIILALEARVLSDKVYVGRRYKEATGERLNLEDPRSFSEKIQWLKLFYRDATLNTIVDKYSAKNFIAETIGADYVVPTHTVYESAKEIQLTSLPEAYVLKATHGSGWNIFKRKGEVLNSAYVKKYFEKWMNKSYYTYSKEWSYKDIKPRIICEELLHDSMGNLPEDIKFFCFNGRAHYIQVDHDRFGQHTRSFYDVNWVKLNFGIKYPITDFIIPRPLNLEKMIYLAEKISSNFPFLRVDMYNLDGRIFCGELTLYPGNGLEEFTSNKWDVLLGKKINLDLKS